MRSYCTQKKPGRTATARGTTGSSRAATWLFCLLTVVTAQAQTGNSEEVSLRNLQQAANAISAGNLAEAETILTAVLASRSRDADALNLLGVVRARQHRVREAERLFRRTLGVMPTHVGAHINLGELYITTTQSQRALQILLAGHRLAPERTEINLKLAELYGDAGNHESALKHLRLIPRSEANPHYSLTLLRSLLKLNRVEEARVLAREFRASGAFEAESRVKFAMLLAGGGLKDEAVELLEDARLQTPGSFPVLYALGGITLAAKRYERAEEYLTAALRAQPENVDALRALAKAARGAGNFEKSLAHLIEARRISPEAPGVLYDFGATALQMGLLLDALPAFQRLNQLHPREPAYLYALAAARLRKGELKEAERLSRTYIGIRPLDGAGFYLLGASLHLLNRYAEAKSALERSLRIRPDPDAEYLLGMTLYEEGNRAAAVERLLRVVRLRPEHAGAQAALGTAYRDLGKYGDARAALERSVELDPKDLRASYQLGLVYAKLGDKEAAKKMFDRADQLRAEQRERETIILKLIEPPHQ
jgi:tetratricopeptide (TPR) repeat protein